jgi:hypothetical protein
VSEAELIVDTSYIKTDGWIDNRSCYSVLEYCRILVYRMYIDGQNGYEPELIVQSQHRAGLT